MLDLRPCLIRNLSMDLEIALKITHGQGQVEVTLTAEILRFAQDDDWVAAEMKTNSGSSVEFSTSRLYHTDFSRAEMAAMVIRIPHTGKAALERRTPNGFALRGDSALRARLGVARIWGGAAM